jgi:hypothetical protein
MIYNTDIKTRISIFRNEKMEIQQDILRRIIEVLIR